MEPVQPPRFLVKAGPLSFNGQFDSRCPVGRPADFQNSTIASPSSPAPSKNSDPGSGVPVNGLESPLAELSARDASLPLPSLCAVEPCAEPKEGCWSLTTPPAPFSATGFARRRPFSGTAMAKKSAMCCEETPQLSRTLLVESNGVVAATLLKPNTLAAKAG